jgi:hypothetical protein
MSLWVQTIPGGQQTEIVAHERKYLQPTGRIALKVVDAIGKPVAARVFITAADGLAYAPENAWMEADDNFVRAERPFEAHYFDTTGSSEITVPAGEVQIDVMRGFENQFVQKKIEVKADGTAQLTVRLAPFQKVISAKTSWVSGDVHTHMNYA